MATESEKQRGYLIGKMSSGRFLLTVVAAIGFLYGIYTKAISGAEIVTICTMVFTLYFTRQRKGDNE